MRIISSKYVRQHSLSHIFNSRVENHKKHIKYRYKILQGIEDPLKFTQMKDFWSGTLDLWAFLISVIFGKLPQTLQKAKIDIISQK